MLVQPWNRPVKGGLESLSFFPIKQQRTEKSGAGMLPLRQPHLSDLKLALKESMALGLWRLPSISHTLTLPMEPHSFL